MLYLHLDFGQYTLNALAIQTFITALAVFTLGIFAISRERGSRVSTAFLCVTLTIGVWLFADAVMYCANSEQIALWWAKASYIGVALIPAASYHYSVLVLREDRKYEKRARYVWIIGFFFLMLVLATDMLFSSLYRYWWGFFPKYRITSIPFLLYYFIVSMDVGRRFWRRPVILPRVLQSTSGPSQCWQRLPSRFSPIPTFSLPGGFRSTPLAICLFYSLSRSQSAGSCITNS